MKTLQTTSNAPAEDPRHAVRFDRITIEVPAGIAFELDDHLASEITQLLNAASVECRAVEGLDAPRYVFAPCESDELAESASIALGCILRFNHPNVTWFIPQRR